MSVGMKIGKSSDEHSGQKVVNVKQIKSSMSIGQTYQSKQGERNVRIAKLSS